MEMPQAKTLGRLVNDLAASRGDAEAVVFGESRVTYRELRDAVRRTAKGLLAIGLKPGDRVGIWLPNSVEWVVADLAVTSIGCVLVGLNTWYKARELQVVLQRSGVCALIVTRSYLRHDYQAEWDQLATGSRTSGGRASVPALPALEWVISLVEGFDGATHTLDEIRRLGDSLDDRDWLTAVAAVDPEAPANLLFTSGSTAQPKGVVLLNRSLIENGHGIGSRQHVTPDDRLWFASPLFFSYGCANGLMVVLSHGATLVLQEDLQPERALETLERERCTVYYASQNMTMALMELPQLDPSKLSLRTGTAIGPEHHFRRMTEKFGISEICNIYGMTETYGNYAVSDASEPFEIRLTWSGTALPGDEIRIVNPETGAQVEAGKPGEIRVRGHVTPGYYEDPERNAAGFDQDGFLRTGDVGLMDKAGRVRWLSRLGDMIKTSGINVAPAEIEEVLDADPRIKRAYVVGLPDELRGELIGAFIELEDGAEMTEDDVRQLCAASLASYKSPRHIEFRSSGSIPFTATGKVRKQGFREEYLTKAATPQGGR